MMHSLAAHGISADMVVGSSVGALNGAYYAGDPTRRAFWNWRTSGADCGATTFFRSPGGPLLGFIWRRDF